MTRHIYIYLAVTVSVLAVLLAAGCSDETSTLYTKERAFFRFSPVTAAPPLYTALENPGQWCTITFSANYYTFTAVARSQTISLGRSALDAYGQPTFIAGFLVGTPSVPDINGRSVAVVYDLACPNCWHDAAVTRSLTTNADEKPRCSRCSRTYDLNISGSVISGTPGRSLLRYRYQYDTASGLFLIQN